MLLTYAKKLSHEFNLGWFKCTCKCGWPLKSLNSFKLHICTYICVFILKKVIYLWNLTCTNSFFLSRSFQNIVMGEVDRSMPYNCAGVLGTMYLHFVRNEKMTNVYWIEKWKHSCFFLACIDDVEFIDECQNHFCLACIDDVELIDEYQIQINKFVKPWKHEELRPLPPFENVIDANMDN